MQIVVTGAGTELGQELLRAIVARGQLQRAEGGPVPVRRILGVDRVQPATLFVDDRIEYVRGDYEQPRFLARVMGAATDSVFHLSARGAACGVAADGGGLEMAFMRSVDTTRALLDVCRFHAHPLRVVFAGTRDLRSHADAVPQSTDAICVDICESLLLESARHSLLDLRSVRLPAGGAEQLPTPMLARAAAALLDAHERPASMALAQLLAMDDEGRLRLAGL